MRRTIEWLLVAAVLAGAVHIAYTRTVRVRSIMRIMIKRAAPCAAPVTYSIGYIDPRFGIAATTLAEDLKAAEAVWEEPSRRDLFEYAPAGGDVTIDLFYDSRQAATDKLKAMGIRTDRSRASYDALKARYDALSAQVEAGQARSNARLAAYRRREAAFNAGVLRWNRRNGGPAAEYARLQAEKAALAREFADVKSLENAVNAHIATLNALATTLNRLIVQLNLNVAQYNRAGASLGRFEAGLYRLSRGMETIEIYEYSDRAQRMRLLAHELGHAMGLEHVSDPRAVMYKLVVSDNLKTTGADLSALNKACRSGILKH